MAGNPQAYPVKVPRKATTRNDLDKKRAQSIKLMASTNTSVPAMAELLGITIGELRRDFRVELKTGHDFVYAAISLKLVQAGLGGDVRSMLAWMRQFGGWQEITRREITGRNGEPISITNLDTSSLVKVIEALATSGTAGGRAGRNGEALDNRTIDVTDLDAISGPPDEGAE